MHFDSAAVQLDLYLTNSYTDPVGIGLIGEVGAGENSLFFDTTLVVQKNFGNWVVAYNLGLEIEIDGAFNSHLDNELTGVLVNSLGVAYSVTQNVRVGGQVAALGGHGERL